MTTFVIIFSTLISLGLFIGSAFFIRWVYNKYFLSANKKPSMEHLNWQTIFALLIALFLVVCSLISPFILTRPAVTGDFDFSKAGPIGDTIGGLMNPFIALGGVIVTGLAFYMQYRANLLQRKLFDEQIQKEKDQFESQTRQTTEHFEKQFNAQALEIRHQRFQDQFYEMLRLHKENVNEMEVSGQRRTEQNNLFHYEAYTITKRSVFVEFKKEFEEILRSVRESDLKDINKNTFEIAYGHFFWGINNPYATEENRSIQEIFEDDKSLLNILLKKKNAQFAKDKSISSKLDTDLYAFEGHSGFLGHYFRHLYFTVKFVVNQEPGFLDYDAKMHYLKILRAQLSNHEQIMLFYNWLSGFGGPWEDSQRHFFTDYCMIHNLWYDMLLKDDYLDSRVNYLKDKKPVLRNGSMFEIDG